MTLNELWWPWVVVSQKMFEVVVVRIVVVVWCCSSSNCCSSSMFYIVLLRHQKSSEFKPSSPSTWWTACDTDWRTGLDPYILKGDTKLWRPGVLDESNSVSVHRTTPCTNGLFAAVIADAENNGTLTLTLFLTLKLTPKLPVCYHGWH